MKFMVANLRFFTSLHEQSSRELRVSRSLLLTAPKFLFVCAAICMFASGCSTFDWRFQAPDPSSATQRSGMTIGARTMPLMQAIEEGLKSNAPSGLYVVAVDARHPAARAGLQKGDVLIACGAKPLDDNEDLRAALDALEPGSKVVFTVWRGGVQRKLLVTPEVAKPRA
jgi:hypothetical protein